LIPDRSRGRIQRAIRTVREIGFAQVVILMRRHGLRGSWNFAARNVRHMIADRVARRWDHRHGVDTAGSIPLDGLSIAGPNRQFGNEYVCTSPNSFDFMMRALPPDLAGYTFVDIGAGKSRTLLLASRYGFAKILGIEFAKELVSCAKANIASFKSDWQFCRNLDIVEADAMQFAFPDTPLVVFFYNPFGREVFDVVLANLIASLDSNQRDCYIVYGSSSHNAIGWAAPAIAASGHFVELPVAAMPFFFDAVRTIRFAAFRSRTTRAR
jgi:SAM-dependent methyltransferase